MEYSLLYHTIIPFALSALVVILVTIIAEKYGTKTGGVIGTLSSTIIIAFLFIAQVVAIEQSTGKKLVLEARKTGNGVADEDKETAKEREKIAEEIAVKTLQLEQGLTEAQAKEVVRRRGILGEGIGATVADVREGYARLDQMNLQLAAGFDRQVTVLHTPAGDLRSTYLVSRRGQPGLHETFLIKTREDAEAYLALPVPCVDGDVASFGAADRELGDRGIVHTRSRCS